MTRAHLFLLVAIGLLGKIGLAQVAPAKFLARTDLASHGQQSVALVDVNNDRILDIVASNRNEVWLGRGDGTFQSPIQASSGDPVPRTEMSSNAAPILAVVDVNGDGKPDLIQGLTTTEILVQFGNGDGTFQAPGTQYSVFGRPLSLAVVDVNGDSHPDIVVGSNAAGVAILLNDGTGGFKLTHVYARGQLVGAVAVHDINGDSIPDIAFGVEGKVEFLLGTGGGSFSYSRSINVSGLPGSLCFADFDGDHKLDLAVGGSSLVNALSQITIFHGNGRGEFGTPQAIPVTGVTQIAVGDVNHDGRLDLVVLESNVDVVGVLLNRGDGTFQAAGNYSAANGAADLALGSLRNNGLVDIVVTSAFGYEVAVLLNRGNGTFQDGLHVPLPFQPTQLISGDFNRDGLDDLASVVNGTIQIFLATGEKRQLFAAGQNIAENAVSLISGDFNGDRLTDLAFSLPDNRIGVVFGHGDGTFGAPTYTAPSGTVNRLPLQICAGDFNGDGKLDLGTTFNAVLLGNGDGTFGPAMPIVSKAILFKYGEIVALASADLNGDGKTDLAVAVNTGGATILPMLNSGAGAFTPAAKYDLGPSIIQLVVSDVNGDRAPDLLLTFVNDQPAYMLGMGGGKFAPIVFLKSNLLGYGIVAGDFNDDGVPDIAVATNVDSSVAVYSDVVNASSELPALWGTAPGSTYLVKGHFYGLRREYQDLAVSSIDGIDILLNISK